MLLKTSRGLKRFEGDDHLEWASSFSALEDEPWIEAYPSSVFLEAYRHVSVLLKTSRGLKPCHAHGAQDRNSSFSALEDEPWIEAGAP